MRPVLQRGGAPAALPDSGEAWGPEWLEGHCPGQRVGPGMGQRGKGQEQEIQVEKHRDRPVTVRD